MPAGARVTRPVVQGQVPGAFGNRRSSSPTGTPRAGRRTQPIAQNRSIFERFRSQIIWGGIVLVVVVVSAFVLISSNQPAYACSIQIDPAPSAAAGASPSGQVVDDMGRQHVTVGTSVHYTFCPPASGGHYNSAGDGPVAARYYGPDDTIVPEGWVHNLEHGAMVILYNCQLQGCDSNSQAQLKALPATFPASPVCNFPSGQLSPVIGRFDQMKASFAAIVWDRVYFQDKLDIPAMLQFYKDYAERGNPEKFCNPTASGSPVASGNPASPDVTNPAANPLETPGASEESGSPAVSSGASAPAGSAPAGTAAPSSS